MKKEELIYLTMIELLNVADPDAMWDLYTNDEGFLIARGYVEGIEREISADLLLNMIMNLNNE